MTPQAKEKPSPEAAESPAGQQRERKTFFSTGFWVLAIITVVEIAFLCAFTDFPLKVMNISPEPVRSLLAKVVTVPPDVQLAGAPGAKPAVRTRPRTRAELISELSRKAPADDVCAQLAQMAHEDGIGTRQQTSDPGSAFVRQIVMCVHTKHWPQAMASDPAVSWATSEMKELQRAGVL